MAKCKAVTGSAVKGLVESAMLALEGDVLMPCCCHQLYALICSEAQALRFLGHQISWVSD